AAHGRTFTVDSVDEEVAVISYEAWIRRFNGDLGVIGKTIRVGRLPMTIVGIAPDGFYGVAPGMAPEITGSLDAFPKIRPENPNILRLPASAWLHVMARLKAGVSVQQADTALQSFWPQIMDTVTDRNMPAARRERFLSRKTAVESATFGFSRV